MTAPETRYSTDPRRVGAGPPPTGTHGFLAVLWDWGTAKPSSTRTRKALGSTGVEKEVRDRDPPHIHKHRFSIAKALRTNPENSVKEGGLCVPPTEL